MKMKLLSFLLMAAFLVFAGCVEDIPAIDELAVDGENGGSDMVVVYLDNFSFHPEYVVISEGDTVKWINNDSAASVIRGNSFQSPALRKGDSFSHTFEDKGTYNYFLISHPWTRSGIIAVE
ncbi:hypothetical protein [Methanolobus halotolerans]|uniref:Plastocyanin n=1 Tax=Methanolobus halotolerans TaxID=2052935 RepID=A0A4E0QU00_9EURY|nr:hypothetical protein [Methanolobus halotolerans]TGC11505.1 hypothetical protein CUN85_01135 [Methanolobus halotolerans]